MQSGSVGAAAAVALGSPVIGVGGGISGIAVVLRLIGVIARGSLLIVVLSWGSVLAELEFAINLTQIVRVVIGCDLPAGAYAARGLVFRTASEQVPEDETEDGDEEDDECPRRFGQDSNQTPITQQAIEESVQCHRCRQDDSGNE